MKQTLTVFSPAKVNLQLEIGERRTDGFHQAKSIMQALTLHDMVTVVLDDGVDAYLKIAITGVIIVIAVVLSNIDNIRRKV